MQRTERGSEGEIGRGEGEECARIGEGEGEGEGERESESESERARARARARDGRRQETDKKNNVFTGIRTRVVRPQTATHPSLEPSGRSPSGTCT